MINPLDHLPGSRKLWLGLFALAVVVVFGTRHLYLHYRHTSYLNFMLGCQEVQGVAESGFHFQEETDSRPFRWTNGNGKLLIPVNTRHPPQRLWIGIETFRPKATPVRLQVLVDGTAMFNGSVPPGKWETTLDLIAHQFTDLTMIELRSETFIPKGVMDNGKNTDTRVLGVQVKGIMLKDREK
ncbi:MAG: hypothetical protein ACYC0X_02405 [Pirellulaceae bacterium]